MELLQLWYFREIAHSGHLSRTAEKLHIAQPSLSQMLKRLENELGISLFDRIGKRLVLNENGVIFLKYTDQIFSALNNAKLELARAHGEKRKTSDIVRILSFAFASGNRKTNSESRSSYPSAYRAKIRRMQRRGSSRCCGCIRQQNFRKRSKRKVEMKQSRF